MHLSNILKLLSIHIQGKGCRSHLRRWCCGAIMFVFARSQKGRYPVLLQLRTVRQVAAIFEDG